MANDLEFQAWYDQSIPYNWLPIDEYLDQYQSDYYVDDDAAYERMCDSKASFWNMGAPWWAI